MPVEEAATPPKKIEDLIDKGDVLSGHRSIAKARDYRADFCSKFGLSYENEEIPGSIPGLISQIDHYIVDVILGIAYYTKRIKKARKQRRNFMILSAILILVIPIYLSLLSSKRLGLAGTAVVAQIIGGLTAIAGLQRAFGESAAANQRYVIWRSTSATLKTLWYGLQTKWPNPPGSVDQAKFVEDLIGGQRAARVAIDSEQDDYFRTLGLPKIDILETLNCAMQSAKTLATGLVPDGSPLAASSNVAVKRATDVAQAQAEIAKNIMAIEAQKDLITEKTAEMQGADDATKKALQDSITSVRSDMTTAEKALINARGALAAAQAPLL